MKDTGKIWIAPGLCLLMVFVLGCSALSSLAGPTPTPTPIPVYMLKGRLLNNNGNVLADTSLMLSNEERIIIVGANGRIENPQGTTDANGRFEIEINEDFLKKIDYRPTVLVSLFSQTSMSTSFFPMQDKDGIQVVIQYPTTPITVDLGDVYAKSK